MGVVADAVKLAGLHFPALDSVTVFALLICPVSVSCGNAVPVAGVHGANDTDT